jgi:Phosphoribulokinase / Uridine kinase family
LQASLIGASTSGQPAPAKAQHAQPFIIGVAGGTACGKTSVCRSIVEKLVADGVRMTLTLARLHSCVPAPHHCFCTVLHTCLHLHCAGRALQGSTASAPAPVHAYKIAFPACTETEFESTRAQADCGRGVLSISQDCFYRDLSPAQREDIASYNFDHPDAFDFGQISRTLRALRRGEAVDVPIYDFVTSARRPETTRVETTEVRRTYACGHALLQYTTSRRARGGRTRRASRRQRCGVRPRLWPCCDPAVHAVVTSARRLETTRVEAAEVRRACVRARL